MRFTDLTWFSFEALRTQPTRSMLTGLGIAVGIAAVILLTSIGEGVHRFVLAEFTQFGTHLLAITPGKSTTTGLSGAVISNVRPLTLDDASALEGLEGLEAVVPMVQGNVSVEGGGHQRRTTLFGVGSAVPKVWSIPVAMGRFLPSDDPRTARPYAVLGNGLRKELFGARNPLGQRVRIGGEAYRVVGVMAPKGQMLGFDLDDSVYIPAGRAMAMFNRESLMEIDVLYRRGEAVDAVVRKVEALLENRHGREDFTIITQEQMLDVLGSILDIITLAVGALGGISLLVGGVGILTIMTIAVRERTREIGLLRALGAERGQIRVLFLSEAVVLSALGGVAGLILGAGGAWLLGTLLPALPVHTPWTYVILAESVAVAVGLLAGVLPALRAARLSPLEALRSE